MFLSVLHVVKAAPPVESTGARDPQPTLDEVMGEPSRNRSYAEIRDYANYAPTPWIPARIGRQLRVSAETLVTVPERDYVWKTSTITRARIGYTFDRPFWVGIELDPLVTVTTNDALGVAPSVKGAASFDHRFFEIGLALGARGVLRELATNGIVSIPTEASFEGAGFMRVGTRDGIHASLRIGGFRTTDSFTWSGIRKAGHQAPVTLRFQTPIAPEQAAWFVWRIGLRDEAQPHGTWMDFTVQVRVTPRRWRHVLLLNVTGGIVDDRGALGGGVEWRLPRFGIRGRARQTAPQATVPTVKRTFPEEKESP